MSSKSHGLRSLSGEIEDFLLRNGNHFHTMLLSFLLVLTVTSLIEINGILKPYFVGDSLNYVITMRLLLESGLSGLGRPPLIGALLGFLNTFLPLEAANRLLSMAYFLIIVPMTLMGYELTENMPISVSGSVLMAFLPFISPALVWGYLTLLGSLVFSVALYLTVKFWRSSFDDKIGLLLLTSIFSVAVYLHNLSAFLIAIFFGILNLILFLRRKYDLSVLLSLSALGSAIVSLPVVMTVYKSFLKSTSSGSIDVAGSGLNLLTYTNNFVLGRSGFLSNLYPFFFLGILREDGYREIYLAAVAWFVLLFFVPIQVAQKRYIYFLPALLAFGFFDSLDLLIDFVKENSERFLVDYLDIMVVAAILVMVFGLSGQFVDRTDAAYGFFGPIDSQDREVIGSELGDVTGVVAGDKHMGWYLRGYRDIENTVTIYSSNIREDLLEKSEMAKDIVKGNRTLAREMEISHIVTKEEIGSYQKVAKGEKYYIYEIN
ncbi:MAG: hypothetical protein ABEJ99_03420 [Candidatus Nanohaloarchaea archaeon]